MVDILPNTVQNALMKMSEPEYKYLEENLNRFRGDLTDEKLRLIFSIAYKLGYDTAISLSNSDNE